MDKLELKLNPAVRLKGNYYAETLQQLHADFLQELKQCNDYESKQDAMNTFNASVNRLHEDYKNDLRIKILELLTKEGIYCPYELTFTTL